ncbi:hypothetical protein [Butyrivibrio sp. AD3002]|uniref:hypothetical protein n=1 Tax=Butyrivibrio sp. AD3002 TaxID=1280670 RepID=UPI0003B6316F|nr:hypothetical protein [Butyrivibrio sp. AD3002]
MDKLLNPTDAITIVFNNPVPNEEVTGCLHEIYKHCVEFADNEHDAIALALVASYIYGFCMRKHIDRRK